MKIFSARSPVWTFTLFALALTSQSARGACPTNKPFASALIGVSKQGYETVTVDSSSVTPIGDELGQYWQSSDATASNNFGGVCPASQWWKLAPSGDFAVAGDLNGGGACFPVGCATGALTAVVEDYGAGTPAPGIGGTAHFIAWKVNETPALLRQYDYARTASESTVYDFVEFPQIQVTSCGGHGINAELTISFPSLEPNFHGATGPCTGSLPSTCTNTPTSSEEVIESWDLFVYQGLSGALNEPGRNRALWTQIQSVPYSAFGHPGVFISVPVFTPVGLTTYLAVGVTFKDDQGLSIPSKLVGRAYKIHCYPVLADPQPNPGPDGIPKKKKGVTVHRTAGG